MHKGKEMSGKVHCIGYIATKPASSSSSSSSSAVVVSAGSKRGRTESFETENTTKTMYKDYYGGCTGKITQSQKAGEFLDKRNGNQGFKQEVKYKSSVKVNDKIGGCTTEYETQVKFKKVTTYNKNSNKRARGAAGSKPSASYKCINYDYYDY